MRNKRPTIILFLVFNTLTIASAFAQSKISGIEAKLFYNQKSDQDKSATDTVSGTFSKEDISSGKFALWNAIGGAGDAEGPSDQTIVIVSIKSMNYSNKLQTIRFTAKARGKTLKQESQNFSVIGDNVTYKVLFLLNDTGCEKIDITADLLVKMKTVSTMRKSIQFECGE